MQEQQSGVIDKSVGRTRRALLLGVAALWLASTLYYAFLVPLPAIPGLILAARARPSKSKRFAVVMNAVALAFLGWLVFLRWDA